VPVFFDDGVFPVKFEDSAPGLRQTVHGVAFLQASVGTYTWHSGKTFRRWYEKCTDNIDELFDLQHTFLTCLR
jgi:hypothetical protein